MWASIRLEIIVVHNIWEIKSEKWGGVLVFGYQFVSAPSASWKHCILGLLLYTV